MFASGSTRAILWNHLHWGEQRMNRLQCEHPAEFRASLFDILADRARAWFGDLLNRLGYPGTIAEAHISDSLTGITIDIRLGRRFTCLSVNGRDFYFHRLTGQFDGTGYACHSPSRASCCIPAPVLRLAAAREYRRRR